MPFIIQYFPLSYNYTKYYSLPTNADAKEYQFFEDLGAWVVGSRPQKNCVFLSEKNFRMNY